jgi:S-adenosylmethionine:tRNA ribosyltransferase-isomerase
MQPARTYPARRDDVRLLVVDPAAGALRTTRTGALPTLFAAGDLLVVNDAATLPASLLGRDGAGGEVEARLIGHPEGGRCRAVLFGAGDWRRRTEDRPPPGSAALRPGARLEFDGLVAIVESAPAPALSPRLVELFFDVEGDALWAALYRAGRPISYSYLDQALPLWAVQTVYAARPWAFEMPSAGRPLSWEILLALRRRGVRWAALTHGAGLSATGDPQIDRALPLPERFDIPAATVTAIGDTRAAGGRVVAVGTTVVRALEGASAQPGGLRPGLGETDLHIDADHRPRVVDGILTGVHATVETHFALLGAFANRDLLRAALAVAEENGLLTHELGDAMLVLPGALAAEQPATRWRAEPRDQVVRIE